MTCTWHGLFHHHKDTYNLRPGDISEGKLSSTPLGTKLTANDCFVLGSQSYNNGDYAHTLQVGIFSFL